MNASPTSALPIDCGDLSLEEYCLMDAAGDWVDRRVVGNTTFLIYERHVAICSPSADCAVVAFSDAAS